jgi:hypothetical protein
MKEEDKNIIHEPDATYQTLKDAEEKRLREDVFRSDIEKFRLFTQMLRTNAILKKAVITHK